MSLKETKEAVDFAKFEERISSKNELKLYLFRNWFGIVNAAYIARKSK